MEQDKGERWLDFLYDDAHQKFNPDGDECQSCGGEGYTFDCIDGCCLNAEIGCDDCSTRCQDCAHYNARIERYIRTEVLRQMNIGLATAWLRKVRKYRGPFPEREVLQGLHTARTACSELTADQRADSACWVECLV